LFVVECISWWRH